jgi:probable phosphomutase (TIGR03848 family)
VTTFLLIRHATYDHVGRVMAGRSTGVHLNDAGLAQARRVAELIQPIPIDAIVSSPLPRALETAAPLAERRGLSVEVLEPLTEIEFGSWTGRSIDELRSESAWTRFNSLRSMAPIPGGELMLSVQARAVTVLEGLRIRYPEGTCAVVSHGDVIRSLVAHCAGIPLDLFHRLEIAPASVSVVVVAESWIGVRCVNLTEDLAALLV